ncbi:MAG: PolC-type DNA polymerase III [Lachnospiraceae bacterium]|nr:PolC-type DNA polymerase III [Lachnospiraceae bacterium]
MSQKFFEVFPNVQLKGEMADMMEGVMIEKLVMTKTRTMLKVYITCNSLIDKQVISRVEKEVTRQLGESGQRDEYAAAMTQVRFFETYHLSELYTPEKLIEMYKESMLFELTEYSPILAGMLRTAQFDFHDNGTINVSIEQNELYKEKEKEFLRILDKIVCERCGLPCMFTASYHERKPSGRRTEKEAMVRRKAALIASLAGSGNQMEGQDEEFAMQGGTTPWGEDADNAAAGLHKNESGVNGNSLHNEDSTNNKSEKKADINSVKTAGTAAGEGINSKHNIKDKPNLHNTTKGVFSGNNKKGGYTKGGYRSARKAPDDPDIFWGYSTDGEIVEVADLTDGMNISVCRGQIWGIDKKEMRRGDKTIVTFFVTDFTDSIKCKIFCENELLPDLMGNLKDSGFYLISGIPAYDTFDKEVSMAVKSMKKYADWREKRMDHSLKKRVELHCHTKYSEMDGVSDAGALVKRAYEWGHPAIAITDHGGVQALADIFHDAYFGIMGKEKEKAKNAGKPFDVHNAFKVIIGCEIYLVDDTKDVAVDSKGQSLLDDFVVFDIETTGFSYEKNNIIEIGAVKVQGGQITDRFSSYVNPREPIPYRIQNLTSISDEMVKDAPYIEEVLPQFMEFCKGCVLVAHNASFDTGFIRENCRRIGLPFDYTWVDTLGCARFLMPQLAKFTLDNLCKNLKIVLEHHHRAVDDAEATAHIFVKFISMLHSRKCYDLNQLNEIARSSDDLIRKSRSYHCIVLAKNDTGRVNLYRLISMSNLRFFNRNPRIPKTLLQQYREGLIIGSACEAGELIRAIVDNRSDEEISSIARFYDYLEIQPIGNNAFMIEDDDHHEDIHTEEDLRDINRKIVKLGETLGKPVCATCDVHFMDPEDELYRRIVMAGKGFKDADQQAPLYLRTTEEMLDEFSYLGMDKAREVVIDNPNLIADMVDPVQAARPDKCPPVIPDSDKTLRDICERRAKEIYGEDLPEIVKERMDRELDSIISNGFAVMYIIAQKLVWKSVEDGYLVGSRGSVGSSFVAYLSGITEVNSLSAHYLCPKCHYVDFDSPEVKAFSGMAGCDMPDKLCPVCGEPLSKEGFDIPFETFLGFKGDKEPDIDLNFSNEYQSKAHKYTEVIFGDGQTFRAGTIGTLAEKTAAGYVRKYYEEHGENKRRSEVERIAKGCTGILRSTGQHPGGIVVLPLGEDINSFTPVQHPANDMTTSIVTTHFDYHKIDHNLLKLDILGHLDPTMIRMLQDLTGVDPVTIPLDDKKVMSLFQDLSALGITAEDIDGCPLGARGIPEFGTDNAIGMLLDTKPKSFTDLVRISGLAHGTDVWEGNAKTLIQEGKATISTAICTRDDIMIYLIDKGLDKGEAFDIMENVRKGKVAGGKCKQWDAWKADMQQHDVPDWYIWSCGKIQYMFPKAHAAAYVMMAWRVGYCKVYYPLAYYTAFFSIRAKAFNYETMCLGAAKANAELSRLKKLKKELQQKNEKLQAKDEDTISDLQLVQEMYARGLNFMPIDIYKAHSRRFQIIDGKIMPALSAIEGMGENAAEQFMEGARGEPFISIDDLKSRTKVPTNVLEKMKSLGLLKGLPESNQLSLFDVM